MDMELGFIESFIKIILLKKKPQEAFPELFFKIMTKIIGLTGGIGSGKTTIANYFRIWEFQFILQMMKQEK